MTDRNPALATSRPGARFNNKTYLIVGASSGIGLATAHRVIAEGGRVIAVARNAERLDHAFGGCGDAVVAYSVDATSEEGVADFLRTLAGTNTRLDGIAFCAGTHAVRPSKLARSAHYADLVRDNLLTITNFIPGVMRLLEPGASFVFLSSAAVKRGGAAVSGYAAAKAAVIGLCNALAAELAPKVRVNAVSAGVVATPMTERFFATIGDAAIEHVKARHPLGIGTPDQVAAAVCFLLSSDASWMTGANLSVDGGFAIAG